MGHSNRSNYSAANIIDESNRSEHIGDIAIYWSDYSDSAANTVSQAASEDTTSFSDVEEEVGEQSTMKRNGSVHLGQQ